MKIRLVGAALFQADGRTNSLNIDRHTDMTELTDAFRNFFYVSYKLLMLFWCLL